MKLTPVSWSCNGPAPTGMAGSGQRSQQASGKALVYSSNRKIRFSWGRRETASGASFLPQGGLATNRFLGESGRAPSRAHFPLLPARRFHRAMYMGFTWPLVGGMAAARAGAGAAHGRGALLAAFGAVALPAGFVLGREVQRRLTGKRRPAPTPGTGTPHPFVPRPPVPRPAAPGRSFPAPTAPAALPRPGQESEDAHR